MRTGDRHRGRSWTGCAIAVGSVVILASCSTTIRPTIVIASTTTTPPTSALAAELTFHVPSASMDPTLKLGDIVAATAGYGAIRRGDIVMLTSSPATARAFAGVSDLMKRVVGLPGDTIESTTTQQITINGQVLDEPYLPPGTALGPPIPRQTVPAGRYFVLGDNRTDSSDSRFFGPIAAAQIVGVVTGIVSPLGRVGAIPR